MTVQVSVLGFLHICVPPKYSRKKESRAGVAQMLCGVWVSREVLQNYNNTKELHLFITFMTLAWNHMM